MLFELLIWKTVCLSAAFSKLLGNFTVYAEKVGGEKSNWGSLRRVIWTFSLYKVTSDRQNNKYHAIIINLIFQW